MPATFSAMPRAFALSFVSFPTLPSHACPWPLVTFPDLPAISPCTCRFTLPFQPFCSVCVCTCLTPQKEETGTDMLLTGSAYIAFCWQFLTCHACRYKTLHLLASLPFDSHPTLTQGQGRDCCCLPCCKTIASLHAAASSLAFSHLSAFSTLHAASVCQHLLPHTQRQQCVFYLRYVLLHCRLLCACVSSPTAAWRGCALYSCCPFALLGFLFLPVLLLSMLFLPMSFPFYSYSLFSGLFSSSQQPSFLPAFLPCPPRWVVFLPALRAALSFLTLLWTTSPYLVPPVDRQDCCSSPGPSNLGAPIGFWFSGMPACWTSTYHNYCKRFVYVFVQHVLCPVPPHTDWMEVEEERGLGADMCLPAAALQLPLPVFCPPQFKETTV